MKGASAVIVDDKKPAAIVLSIPQQEVTLSETPDISRGAWKVIIFLLVGGVLFLASIGAYVLSGLHRFQDCL